ncbi:YjfB family protein [Pseudomonas sp. PDM14]|uniref:YjfB family protein n=1 Tax=Pseudomonas sp. PDM14 TaxID=2769288 RepID=UPI00177BF9EA|nr:YjfB family protein [Pseudomonas sp. PDM14]MBD9484894.1 YjfB family protein [Pseudomonas sp. PDM14]
MELSGIASAVSTANAAQTNATISVIMLQKALEMQSQTAIGAIQAIPNPASNPPNLGNSVDVMA